ncbi:hypothetical protein GK047_12315 [Paenibacillus sp. SYP-B3998]|uniref:Uncharacterized protein n=1 Tax=Paenibacillus sp. SYP-B3998 TaxID=2678564 RepID=A0A6G3ZX49_9BACL|nr:hypothetical protein [Paenibacillus sp. SYP-B3998]NEW06796.1 hypothetical protein [Paenibacillus sp. SYP-B3998]
MNLLVHHVYGIVYRNANGTLTVFNGRIEAKGLTTITLKFMNSRDGTYHNRESLSGMSKVANFDTDVHDFVKRLFYCLFDGCSLPDSSVNDSSHSVRGQLNHPVPTDPKFNRNLIDLSACIPHNYF